MSYSPKIKNDLVKQLYQLKKSCQDKPLNTKLVNKFVNKY